ncbi:MAG: MMPL family transporter, partial [Alphaproteobacteria bacterium]
MSSRPFSSFAAKLDALAAQWVDFVRRHATLVLIIGSVATFASIAHVSLKLRIITNTDEMLSTDLPFRKAEQKIYAAFPDLKDILIVIVDGEQADNVDDAATLLAHKLQERPDLFRHVFAPADNPFLRQHGLLYLTPDALTAMAGRLEESRDMVGLMAQDPSLRGFFAVLGDALRGLKLGYARGEEAAGLFETAATTVAQATAGKPGNISWRDILAGGKTSKDDRRRFILVQPVIDYTSFDPGGPAMDTIRAIADALKITSDHGLRLRLTGDVALYREELQTVNQGMVSSTLVSIFLGTVILAIGMGSWRLSFACLAVLCVGLLWTASFGLITVGRFNVISITFAAMFVGLGIDYAAHLGLRYREARIEGSDHAAALRIMAASQFSPLLWCTLTSIVSFLSFAPTAYKGIAELGLISSGGMILAVIINYTFLPAVLT